VVEQRSGRGARWRAVAAACLVGAAGALGGGPGPAPVFAGPVGIGPLIVGNSGSIGDGPIETWYGGSGGSPIASFVPDGAADGASGRGLALIGNELFYTELTGGSGPTDLSRVAPFNGGLGAADTRSLPNPDRATGIAALATAEGVLYVLSGHGGSGPPRVYGLDPSTGTVASGPVDLDAPADADSDGFAVLPNGNFLVNTGEASCTFAEFDGSTGNATGTDFTVPDATTCTGVDTDGTSLFIATDGDGFTRTSLTGTVLSTASVDPNLVQDIALIRVSEDRLLTALSPVHAWLGLRNSDDQGTQFDVLAELLLNDEAVATGLRRCITGVTRNPASAKEATIDWADFDPLTIGASDVLTVRLSVRIGTTPTGARCAGPGGSHASASGLRFYYDSAARASRLDLTLDDHSSDAWFHSNGTACGSSPSTGVSATWLDDDAPAVGTPRCRDSAGLRFAGGNPWKAVGTWFLELPG
jgi:hypothetical protein